MITTPEAFRTILRMWASGITVVTAGHDGELHGMTVSSFSSVSLEPPLVSVNIERRTRAHVLVVGAEAFAVCILANDQRHLAQRFGGGIPDDQDRFEGLAYRLGQVGSPILEGCLATMECKVHGAMAAGTHTVFVGEVLYAEADQNKAPLLYFDREYRTFGS